MSAYSIRRFQNAFDIMDNVNIIFFLGIVVALVVYLLFLNPKNERKFSGFVKWFYNFLNFRVVFIEAFIKILYMALLFTTIIVGLYTMFVVHFGYGVLFIIFGLLFFRVMFELIMISVMLYRNTTDIRKKLIDNGNENDDLRSEGGYEIFESLKNKVNENIASYNSQNNGQNINNANYQQSGQRNVNSDYTQNGQRNVNFDYQQNGQRNVNSDYTQSEQKKVNISKGKKSFCQNCGAPIGENDVFCSNCGKPV